MLDVGLCSSLLKLQLICWPQVYLMIKPSPDPAGAGIFKYSDFNDELWRRRISYL